MSFRKGVLLFMLLATIYQSNATYFNTKSFDCGPYGFVCEGSTRLRLCEGNNLMGPAFKCPANTICNEDSSDVCDNTLNFMDPTFTRALRCHKNERIADPNVPGCKGYILCIPNKDRFQGIKFKCAGNTIFNGYTRTCSSPDKYKCPLDVTTPKPTIEIFESQNRRIDGDDFASNSRPVHGRPECKNYKFSVTDDNSPVKAAYFCPSRPVQGETSVRCTVFSSKFCLTLERDDEDQFINSHGVAFRRPRIGA
ncbi:hypothetical protein ABMA28_016386 [Loxostege sticticalis]|uniref:Chitin-binding type-2 domain-containing protein n=1 Tax=Loxostege sticticalis TaxID=481309 RepID=A0ABD0TCG5_LOXSC